MHESFETEAHAHRTRGRINLHTEAVTTGKKCLHLPP